MRNKGFTLIELIVTITIIMLVSVVVAMNFGGTNTRARDSRRKADVERIRTALELYRQQMGFYPLDTGGTAAIVPDFLQVWPTDPKTNYLYVYDVGGSYTYSLYAKMEDVGSTTGVYGTNCIGGGYIGDGRCNYMVTNP